MKYRRKINGQWGPWENIKIKSLDSLPIGTGIEFYGPKNKIPTGFLICDGSAISRTTYSDLFELIGTTYGTGDGSTTFNLPDYQGRVGVGINENDTDFNVVGETGGSKELQSHNHGNLWQVGSGGGTGTGSYDGMPSVLGSYAIPGMASWNTKNAGTGDSGNLQPYIAIWKLIKATNTTPTMASVVNSYNTSTEDSYSCDYQNKHYGGVELFTGYTSGNVTLSDSASNYSYIEVYGQKSGCYGYVKIYSPNGKQFGLAVHNAYESNNIQQIFGRYTISGTTITKDFEVYMNNNSAPSNSNDIKIEKVIGYK